MYALRPHPDAEPGASHPSDARPLTLTTRATSPEAHALMATAFAMVQYSSIGKGNRRGAAREQAYRSAVEALLSGVLLNAGRHGQSEWSYQPLSSPYFTNQPVAKRQFEAAHTALVREGLIERTSSFTKFHGEATRTSGAPRQRFATRFRATPALLRLCAEHSVDLPDPPDPAWTAHFRRDLPTAPQKPIVLRAFAKREGRDRLQGDELPIDTMDPRYQAALHEVEKANDFIARFTITGCDPIVFRRRYTHDFQGQGRWYAAHLELPSEARKHIRIDGAPVVEVDVIASHLTILHGRLGLPLPDREDIYDIPGIPREVAKRWINATIGAGRPLQKWPSTAAAKLRAEGVDLPRYPAPKVGAVVLRAFPFLRDLVSIWECPEEPRIAGQRIMWREAMALTLALDRLRQKGIPALPLHDALIVREAEREAAVEVLKWAYRHCAGITPRVR